MGKYSPQPSPGQRGSTSPLYCIAWFFQYAFVGLVGCFRSHHGAKVGRLSLDARDDSPLPSEVAARAQLTGPFKLSRLWQRDATTEDSYSKGAALSVY